MLSLRRHLHLPPLLFSPSNNAGGALAQRASPHQALNPASPSQEIQDELSHARRLRAFVQGAEEASARGDHELAAEVYSECSKFSVRLCISVGPFSRRVALCLAVPVSPDGAAWNTRGLAAPQ